MEAYIKYKRIYTSIIDEGNNIQTFFDDLSGNGWDIVYYNEKTRTVNDSLNGYLSYIDITIVVGKRQNSAL